MTGTNEPTLEEIAELIERVSNWQRDPSDRGRNHGENSYRGSIADITIYFSMSSSELEEVRGIVYNYHLEIGDRKTNKPVILKRQTVFEGKNAKIKEIYDSLQSNYEEQARNLSQEKVSKITTGIKNILAR